MQQNETLERLKRKIRLMKYKSLKAKTRKRRILKRRS